ncbi:MAG: DUF1343 domain-containing protein [Elusimicrobia bacterium]|nr:DUF1343 domain-containing protein [Elusimicrobiota bacterium]
MSRPGALLGLMLFAGAMLQAQVKTGLDVLVEEHFAPLWGKRVGVIANQSAVDREGRNVVNLLKEAPGVTLAAVFTPEHGLTGKVEHGRPVADGVLPGTDVPVYSLYGATQRPTPRV